uniref:RNA silencing suppressor n=2 Tax=Grapevine Kizil Sapak virus TaxID=2650001 RepID=A0A646RQT1_9VIRU|nr:nucleic acid binding protein [Grapevine Kizil Sapak virus]QDC33517.1 nucleic acid binding protein [Grapevine Kizil Sapak virus]
MRWDKEVQAILSKYLPVHLAEIITKLSGWQVSRGKSTYAKRRRIKSLGVCEVCYRYNCESLSSVYACKISSRDSLSRTHRTHYINTGERSCGDAPENHRGST